MLLKYSQFCIFCSLRIVILAIDSTGAAEFIMQARELSQLIGVSMMQLKTSCEKIHVLSWKCHLKCPTDKTHLFCYIHCSCLCMHVFINISLFLSLMSNHQILTSTAHLWVASVESNTENRGKYMLIWSGVCAML